MIRGVLFDVDGTLVDSNYLHIDAWSRAFRKIGVPIDAWRIHRGLGMDSDRMLQELLGDDANRLADAAKKAHSRFYRKRTDRLRAFSGAAELLNGLADEGVAVVLATSASAEELDILIDVLGIDADRFITTHADDVETAKPHPAIIEVALRRAQVEPRDALFVGDSVWDMVAATKAGVATAGVRTGGVGAEELLAAGADRVVDSVADLTGLFQTSTNHDEETAHP